MKPLTILIPAGVKSLLRRMLYFPGDLLDGMLGRRDAYTPPKGIMFIGKNDFKKVGEEFCGYLIDLGHLKPDGHILDVGCGLGRMAVPLIGYLNDRGRFEGFDVVRSGITWATRAITARHPNFRFQVADLYNKFYNPKGKTFSHEYVFPYADASFDVVFLGSVFTHMLPRDVEHFLDEITRVLKPGGTALITFFLLNQESRALLSQGRSSQNFVHPLEMCLTVSADKPEAAISYPEEHVRALYAARGLSIVEPVRYGSWCGRSAYLSYQDIVLATKP